MGQARVEVTAGPAQGARRELAAGARLVVGRGSAADLSLDDPTVSRRHLALVHQPAGVLVEDLGGHGGAWVGDRPLGPDNRLIRSEALLHLGRSTLRVQVEAAPPARPGPQVPGLQLMRRLGEGGSGEVWAARDLESGAAVAVKLLHPDADPTSRRRFEQEAGLALRLSHPAIARVLRLVRAGDRPCLVRELVPGPSLLERIEAGGPLPWPEACRLGAHLARALAHVHERGLIHRDVKPGNVLLGAQDGLPRLIDLDLARRLVATRTAALTRLTQTGEGLGTLSYVAPEQLRSARDADARADVYGLGLTLHHALSGRLPFGEVEPEELLDAILVRGVAPLGPAAPGVPPALAAAVEEACAVDRERRCPSAEALAVRLERLLLPD